MVTCSFKSLSMKFLDQIIHMQSLIALSMQDYLPANVLLNKFIVIVDECHHTILMLEYYEMIGINCYYCINNSGTHY